MLGSLQLLIFVCFPVLKTELQQSPVFLRAHPGESANITCCILTEIAYCSDMVWYFQQHTEAPQRIDKDSRTYMSDKAQEKNCVLKISNLMRSDSGTYFCSLCRYRTSFFGNGTQLIVKDSGMEKPSIFILGPSKGMFIKMVNVILVCLVFDPPDNTSVYWNVSGEVTTGRMGSELITADGDYSVTNELTIPIDTWDKKLSIRCIAGTEYRDYSLHKDKGRSLQIILGTTIALLLFIIIIIIICYQRRLKREKITKSEISMWESSVNNSQKVIYQTVKGAGSAKKGKKRNKTKQATKEDMEDIHYASLEMHSR
ncbi:immunoglobulin kappa light chain-like [Protopterus annectens]|uniref:immunoglobulin kappa light chain-like n=1 Tax=Protopterus annectens TaxID=7888 RepID=UPI001CF987E3|nr:immunoglobulin kappa light chain-like [Protopterus annectens]